MLELTNCKEVQSYTLSCSKKVAQTEKNSKQSTIYRQSFNFTQPFAFLLNRIKE